MFFDTHAHLHYADFEPDRLEMIRRAESAGVKFFLNVGTDLASSQASLALAETQANIWAAAGIHPHDAVKATEADFSAIESLMAHPRMVALGEVGLDFYRDHSPVPIQRDVFRRFVEMALRVNKPLVIHCRDAYEALMEMLRDIQPTGYQGVIHCFSSDKMIMESLLNLGFYISFAGPLSYKKNDVLREACAACPQDRLLLETDAPFLPPQTLRGKRNESAYMLETAAVMAELHGLSLEKLAELTTANACRRFRL
jgi:TatD DNase family protein